MSSLRCGAWLLHCVAAATCMQSALCAQGSSDTPLHPIQVETQIRAGSTPVGLLHIDWQRPLIAVVAEVRAPDAMSVGEAYLRAGARGWSVTAGRRRLSIGDERLVGANREIGGGAPGWDGASAAFSRGRASLEMFSCRSRYYGSTLHGALAGFEAGRWKVQPYWLRKADRTAGGLHTTGSAHRLDFNFELAVERGDWAGHAEVSRGFERARIAVEWNQASRGFDEFFPARLNAHSTEDPFGWTDTRNGAVNFSRTLSAGVQLTGSYRAYWNAAGAYQTGQAVAGMQLERSHWTIAAGCGRLIASMLQQTAWTGMAAAAFRF